MANQINTGNAQTVAQVDTLAITWGAAGTFSFTINGKTVSVAADTSSAQTASDIQVALSSQAAPAEFRQITWTVATNVVTGTGATSAIGAIPFTLTFAVSGSGNAVTHTVVTAATGPNYWNNPANWASGTLPASADTVYFTGNWAAAVQYGMGQTAVALAGIYFVGSSTQLGLPQQNAGGYDEYNPFELAIGFGVLSIDVNSEPTLVRLNCSTATFAANVQSTGGRAEAGTPALTITGGNSANSMILGSGDVGIAAFIGETSSLAGGLTVGQPNNQGDPSTLSISSGCTAVGTTTFNSGTANINSPNLPGSLTQHGGTLTYGGTSGLANATIKTGTLAWNSTGTLANISLIPDNPGAVCVLDLSTAQVARAITSLVMAAGTEFNDPNHLAAVSTLTLGSGTTWNQITINNGAGRVYTPVS